MRALVLCGLVACHRGPWTMSFEKVVIDPAFRSEGAAVFDVDRDGHLDIVTEELWYAGPDFVPHEVRDPRAWDPLTEYASSFGAFHMDVDGDRYDDLVVFHFPSTSASWCKNPRGQDVHWDCFEIHPAIFGETPILTTMFDKRSSLLVAADGVVGWIAPDPVAPEQPWILHPLTAADLPQAGTFGHGLGLADVNGDRKPDLLTGAGWFEQPSDPAQTWPYHEVELCPNNCSHMFTYDVDGDGVLDVIGASPHDYGAWWWRQDASTFTQHEIDLTISENHSARFVDLDGDDIPELITGKRYWAHLDHDPGAYDPVLLVAYKLHRDAGEVTWERIELDDDSGVGSHQFEVADMNGDGKPDIVVATRKGLFLFRQH